MRAKAKTASGVAIGIIIATIVVAFLSFYLRNQNTQPAQQQTTENAINNADLTTAEAVQNERNAIELQKNNVQTALSEKNGWSANDFTIIVLHIDSEFIAGEIAANDSEIPEGIFLAKAAGQGNFEVIFDSSTPEPCTLLEKETVYPQLINNFCRR